MNRYTNLKSLLMKHLDLNEHEAELFLGLMKVEKTSSNSIHKFIDMSSDKIIESAKNLEEKGMVIEINKNEYRALHPRFAAVNRYRRICDFKNIPLKKNVEIDKLGLMLERYQNIV